MPDNHLKGTSHRVTESDLLKAVKANTNQPSKKEGPNEPIRRVGSSFKQHLCHEPFEAGPLEPWLCNTLHGHDRVPTFFWGLLTDHGSLEEGLVATLRDIEYLFAAQPAIPPS